MATQAKIATNDKRKKLAAKYAQKRAALKAIVSDPKSSDTEKLAAANKLNALPRNSSRQRIRNRCALTGRPRGVYRKFGLGRNKLRDLALKGEVPGVIKASW
ncbi:MAG TPA: 30S ribosomal protein S14 [Polyangiales bacterium]